MNATEAATLEPGPQTPPSTRMIIVLTFIAMVSGFLIVIAYTLTLPVIQENKRIALEKAILEILPGTQKIRRYLLAFDGALLALDGSASESGVNVDKLQGVRIYRGQDAGGAFNGLVIEATGTGFQDIINVIYAYDPVTQTIRGLKVMESKETPGLGDKIESDPQFRKNFAELDASLNAEGNRTAHAIVAVKSGKKTKGWEIDGITGATISSKAIGAILHKSTNHVLPVVQKNLDRLGVRRTHPVAAKDGNDRTVPERRRGP